MVVGITADPNTLFPWKATQFQAVAILTTIYGTLTELDQDLNVVPGIAEKLGPRPRTARPSPSLCVTGSPSTTARR